MKNKKSLCVFSMINIDDMISKGNIWYIRNYEIVFERVFVFYLFSRKTKSITRGRTTLVSFGGSSSRIVDFLTAPIKFYKYCKIIKFDIFVSPDILFSWFSFIILKHVNKFKYLLMPVCMPHELYKNRKKTMMGLPLFLEKLFIFFSFNECHSVITSKSFGSFVQWLSNYSQSKNKLKFISILPEALPTNKFIRDSFDIDMHKRYKKNKECFLLLYVGGLREEKLVEDVLKMLSFLIKNYKTEQLIKLKIIGDGPARMQLGNLARDLGIESNVFFDGSLSNENLVEEYSNADVFVSPLTGTSLREAALCGLPIVAYDIDWISGFFKNGENILLAKNRNFEEMAELVYLLYSNVDIRIRLSKNILDFARKNFIFWEDQKEIVLSEYENAYK